MKICSNGVKPESLPAVSDLVVDGLIQKHLFLYGAHDQGNAALIEELTTKSDTGDEVRNRARIEGDHSFIVSLNNHLATSIKSGSELACATTQAFWKRARAQRLRRSIVGHSHSACPKSASQRKRSDLQ